MNELEKAILEAKESIVKVDALEREMIVNGMDYGERRITLLSNIDMQTECVQELEEEISILQKQKTQTSEMMNSSVSSEKTPPAAASHVLTSQLKNLNVTKYLAQFTLGLKCHRDPVDFLDILPTNTDVDAKRILIHLQGLPQKENMELQKMYHEMKEAFPEDPILDELEQQLNYYDEVINFLKEYRENLFSEDPVPVEELVSPHERNLIFLHNTNSTYIEDEIENMPHNVYGKLYKAFAGFHYGYKRIEKSLSGSHVRGMKEVREGPIRLFITNLEDSYVILGAIVKKVQSSKEHSEYIDRKMKLFYDNQDFLLEQKHTNPLFMLKEKERAETIEKVLLQKQEGTKVKKYEPRTR